MNDEKDIQEQVNKINTLTLLIKEMIALNYSSINFDVKLIVAVLGGVICEMYIRQGIDKITFMQDMGAVFSLFDKELKR